MLSEKWLTEERFEEHMKQFRSMYSEMTINLLIILLMNI